ncbi:hypothetical protein [Paractinoplanes toevensis]|uniref:Uncharacterized protein n=1 Tax=Paractinoplanes toevensis TaxID=571911 RepID=A0A919TEI0_9ACTN|nr:hypothetical protein [Actinoplanes toevensis]GIM93627.1 hypothetical protein Ato02nite_054200 [Actinoplanes toevensis]
MTLSEVPRPPRGRLRPDTVLDPDSLVRALIDAATPGPAGADRRLRYVPLLGRRGELPDDARKVALRAEATAAALPDNAIDRIDAEAVAGWLSGRYAEPAYPAVVFGSPHGSAVHLAAALGGAWLPTSFRLRVPWPGGSPENWTGAAEWGREVAGRILAANPTISVRQVHDPVLDGPLCGATVTLHLRWRRLPAAYSRFLRTRLAPGGLSLTLRDLRTWPVHHLAPGHTMQLGSPVSGLSAHEYDLGEPGLRGTPTHRDALPQYAEAGGEAALETEVRHLAALAGHHTHRALYSSPDTLSRFVADLYRGHLRAVAGRGESCLIETGRLISPSRVIEHGLVPYWCESAALPAIDAAEWWLAGSDPFDRLSVLPEPPGTAAGAHAGLVQWRSLARFARHDGWVDRLAAGRYPTLPIPRSNVVRVITQRAAPAAPVPLMTNQQVIAALRQQAPTCGIFVD